ncbi:hypothetical protein QAD02_002355 [Eretmocerus hayati]|uniref:Uncharacterized protein n=1 Tax=Eretmocerus hayati TaxID=131215 RepID=A0ACC2NKD6_9HYME|nr:hypothetical protein QAD02_002355 [Eretmocerus hayati]
MSSDGSVGKTTTATVHSAVGNPTIAPVAVEMGNFQLNQLPIAILNKHSGNDGQKNCTFHVGATEIVVIESDEQLVPISESQSLALQQTLMVAGASDFNGINGPPSSYYSYLQNHHRIHHPNGIPTIEHVSLSKCLNT